MHLDVPMDVQMNFQMDVSMDVDMYVLSKWQRLINPGVPGWGTEAGSTKVPKYQAGPPKALSLVQNTWPKP